MTVRHRSRGEGRERSSMRTCGAEKLPWLVIEVEVDAERAGCFAERQLRLGLVGEEAIPETRDRLGRPAERTKARLRVRIGAVHEGVDRGGTAQVLSHTHLNPRGRGVPPERKSDRLEQKSTVSDFRCWSERNSSNNFLYRKSIGSFLRGLSASFVYGK